MNFKEAFQELKNGKRLTRTGWEQKNFLRMDDNGEIQNFIIHMEPYLYDQSIILSEGWIIKDGNPDQKMPFLSALEAIKVGSSIALPEWDGMWVTLDKSTSQMILNSYRNEPFMPTFTCFMLNDWEVV